MCSGPQGTVGRGRQPHTFSSCSMQGVCTTILQAAHFLRDTDFCCGTEREGLGSSPGGTASVGRQKHPLHCHAPLCLGPGISWLSAESWGAGGSCFPPPQEGLWRTGATALALPPGGSRLHSRHSPAFWLHSTAPQHSRSPLTRWSRTRCVPHMLLIPGARDRRLSACRQLGPTLSNSPLLPPLLRLDHARTQEGPGAPLPAAPSCTFALYPQLPHGQSTAPPLPPLAHYSRSSPRCFGSAAQTRHTGHQGLEEGVPGAGGPT